MSLDSIGLIAQQSYNQIQDRPKIISNDSVGKAASFHDIVNKQFNSFAELSPDQILNRIQNARQGANSFMATNTGNIAGSVMNNLSTVIRRQEDVARKSLIGEASLIDLLTATTEAKNVMEATVMIRNKFIETWEKVMTMSM